MAANKEDYKFILNQWAFGENGAVMNAATIKKTRNDAASKILEILQELERATGMLVTCVNTDDDFGISGERSGVTEVTIDLDLD